MNDSKITLLNFNQVLEGTSENRCLLIGNGFNIAYDPAAFGYKTLKQLMGKNLFQTEEYTNKSVEDIMWEIKEHPSDVSNHIRQLFIKAITISHPEFNKKKADHCARFLNNFRKIYTLNYDLLLYWVINNNEQLKRKFLDGFGVSKEKRGGFWPHRLTRADPTTTYYMHGALHLFCDNSNSNNFCPQTGKYCTLDKLGATEDEVLFTQGPEIVIPVNISISLRTRVTNYIIRKNVYPHFISEGDPNTKQQKIEHCQYLAGCYKSLCGESSDVVIFGVSFNNDQHILKAIASNNVQKCFVGIFGDPTSEDNQKLIQVTSQLANKSKSVFYFDSASASVWD